MSNDKDWRQFELLVARIEKILAPRGASVKSPDRIRNILTGRLREVDASIRVKIGSVSILITVECRKRSKIQDDRWIEELATKKKNLGAAKTIAVSASGFTDSAKITARSEGIELRTIEEVNDKDIFDWFKSVVLVHKILRIKLKSISAEIDGVTPSIYKFEPADLTGSIKALVRVEDNMYVSPYKVLELIIKEHSSDLLNIRPDGNIELIMLSAQLPKRTLQVQSSEGNQCITSITYEIERWYETKTETLSKGYHYKYLDNEGILVHGAEYKTEVEGIPIVVDLALTDLGK